MSESVMKHALKTASTMIAFAFAGTLMLAYVFDITREPILANEREARLALFKQILPESSYNNAVLNETLDIAPNELLGNRLPAKANVARLDSTVSGVILEAIAHDGYAGDIKLLIAINADGTISGVRVLTHKETPGLGDYIDITRSNWIKIFDKESLEKTPAQLWQVKKDGGQFDYMAGATITPRAVVKAVVKALQFFEQNKETLLMGKTEVASDLASGKD